MRCGHCSAELIRTPGGYAHPDGQVAAHRTDDEGRTVVDHVARPYLPRQDR